MLCHQDSGYGDRWTLTAQRVDSSTWTVHCSPPAVGLRAIFELALQSIWATVTFLTLCPLLRSVCLWLDEKNHSCCWQHRLQNSHVGRCLFAHFMLVWWQSVTCLTNKQKVTERMAESRFKSLGHLKRNSKLCQGRKKNRGLPKKERNAINHSTLLR